jgi:inosose dehydratase
MMAHWSLTGDEGGQAEALASIAAAGELAHDLVPDAPPIVETVVGGSPARWNEQKAGMADRLGAWADAAEKADIGIALKAHVGSAVNSPERLLALLGEVKSPRLHAVYDFSHFELQGMDLETTMQALLPRTKFIHVKDSRGDAKQFEFLLPGAGRTDYERYFTLLRRWRYAGPVCVEVSGQVFNKPGYDAVAAARQSYAALAPALERAYSG